MLNLMIHITYNKYEYVFIYIWSNLKKFDSPEKRDVHLFMNGGCISLCFILILEIL